MVVRFWYFFFYILSFAFFLIGLINLFFFRNPSINLNINSSHILSPASGHVLEVVKAWDPVFKKRVQVIRIFLSIFDVHVQRYPISGSIFDSSYSMGKFLDARNPLSSSKNEQNSIILKGKNLSVIIRQISGFIARRIDTYGSVGSEVIQGEELGIIYFGSRVEILFENFMNIKVRKGDYLKAGVSVLALV